MDVSLDYSCLNKDELDEMHRVNEETIDELKKEILLLERNLEQYGPGGLIDTELDINSLEGSRNADEVIHRIVRDIDNYTHRLTETAKLTGVVIENIERQEIEMDNNQCRKQFYLELLILDRKVLVTYKLQETLSDDKSDPSRNKLVWFEVKFTEDINNAIGREVTKAVDNVAIHSTFSLLKSYIQWLNLQEVSLDAFLKKYPNNLVTSLSEKGNCCLKIKSTKPNRPVFYVEWGRKVVVDRVEADIKLTVDAPKELLAIDSKHILNSSPKIFHGMLEALGLERAIESLIQLVATDGREN